MQDHTTQIIRAMLITLLIGLSATLLIAAPPLGIWLLPVMPVLALGAIMMIRRGRLPMAWVWYAAAISPLLMLSSLLLFMSWWAHQFMK